jgi:tetratricopeptide (TPR) repeat protein
LGYQGRDASKDRGSSGGDASSREQKQVDEPIKTDLKADAALAEIRKAIEAKPNDHEAYYRYGLALAGRHEFAQAATEFRKALALKPDYAEAHYQFGLALAGQGQLAQAITEYRMALKLKPDLEEARRSLGEALETQPKDR